MPPTTPKQGPCHRRIGWLLLGATAAGCTATAPAGGGDGAGPTVVARVCNGAAPTIVGRVYESTPGQPLAAGARHVVFVHGPAADAPLPPLTWRCAGGVLEPALLVAAVGQQIRFTNDDELCHRFFSSKAPHAFDLGTRHPGDSAALRFDEPGVVHVYCSLHGGRQATVLVVPTPHFAVVSAAGEFTITGLRPGRYDLETWSEQRAPQHLDVTVPEHGTRFVRIVVDAPPTEPSR